LATLLYPSWELLQDRADVLRAYGDANITGRDWATFRSLYIASHRVATLADFDLAERIGFPLSVNREFLRNPKDESDYYAIADAFEEAASRLKQDERSYAGRAAT
jgi:hypothetical protein